MEDYLGCNLVGEMENSKIINEANLFRNRPWCKVPQMQEYQLTITMYQINLFELSSTSLA